MRPIGPEELCALMAAPASHAVFDLRERARYEGGHVFRATSLPRRLLEFRLPALVPARRTPVAIYDEDGALLALAARTLAGLGYTEVRALAGGVRAWRAAGRPLVQGLNVPSKVFGEQVLHDRKTPQIPPGELAGRIARGDDVVIVDTRTPEEYARGCVPGAWNVPGGELVLRIGELVPRPDTTIVVHCGGRTRSYIGAESLRRMGLPNPIVALENGTMGWQLAGLELERGAARWPPAVSARGLALAAPVAARVAAEDGVARLAPAELRRLRDRGAEDNVYVLDVRTAEEYAAGHVAGAVWAPGGQAVQATDEYVAVHAGTIVLVCDGTVRATLTGSWLRRMGFPRVAVLDGGLPAWVAAGGAVATGLPPSSPAGAEAARAAVGAVAAAVLARELAGPRAPVVLDVGTSDAHIRGHVPAARWLCRSRLELRAGAVLAGPDHPVVVTCPDGWQSLLGAATLAGLGYRARVLDGGVVAWSGAGLPLEREPRLADEPDDVVLKPYDRGRDAMVRYLRWEEALNHEGRSPHPLMPAANDGGEADGPPIPDGGARS
jgi:rhodanese-related sulfurtransferase